MKSVTIGVLIALAACTGGASASQSPKWAVVNLNGASGLGSIAWGVDGATVVGQSVWGGEYRAARWTGAPIVAHPLPSPPGFARALGVYGESTVGYTGFYSSRAALWAGGSVVDLNPKDALDSVANGAWDGVQVGSAFRGGSNHAAIWSGSAESFVDLHPLGAADSGLLAVDNSGQAGSIYWTQPGEMHAALWHGTAESAVDLHPAGAYASSAQAIADGRQGGYVQFERDGTYYPAVWSGTAESFVNFSAPGAPTDAGVIYGMQGNLLVGGARFLDGSGGATIWFGTPESAFNLASLLSSDYTRSEARAVDIDEFGTIRVVGYAYNNNYYLPDGTHYPRNEAMMWVLVPEPSSLVALAAGLAALAKFRWRR